MNARMQLFHILQLKSFFLLKNKKETDLILCKLFWYWIRYYDSIEKNLSTNIPWF